MKLAVLFMMFVVLVGGHSRADDMRVASVDVARIFEEWTYTVKSEQQIKKAKELFEKENNDRLAVINEYQMMRSRLLQKYKANEGTMSDVDKKTMDAKFRSLGLEVKALEQDRRDFVARNSKRRANESSSEARMILDRIIQAIQTHALEKQYDMVIEMGGHTSRNLPLFVYLEGAVEITDEVIARLNENGGN